MAWWKDNLQPTLAVLSLLLIAACATPGVERSGSAVSLNTESVPGQGHVAIKVVPSRPVSALNPRWKSIVLESKAGQVPVALDDFAEWGANASLFFGRIPEGDYEVVRLESIGPGGGLMFAMLTGDYQNIRDRIGTFSVRHGSVTNLGTIVVAPAEEAGKPARIEYLAGELGRRDVAEHLRRRTGQALTLPQIPGPAVPGDEQQALVRARAWMSSLSPAHDAKGAALFGGASLGQIVLRDARGTWQTIPLELLDDVTYARRLEDGTLLAGLTQGRYAVRKAGQWRLFSLPEKNGLVDFIDVTPDGGAIFAVSTPGKAEILYKKALDDQGAEVRSLAAMDALIRFGRLAHSFDDRVVFVQNHPGISRTADFVIVDKSKLQVRTEKRDFWVNGVQQLPDGALLVSRQNGMSYFVSVSEDKGGTWRHGETAGPVFTYFVDRSRGHGVEINRGAFSVSVTLMKTADGGKTWTKTGAPLSRDVVDRILWAGPDGEVIVSAGFEVYSTTDDGATWRKLLPRRAAP
jgi:hypothetical protein